MHRSSGASTVEPPGTHNREYRVPLFLAWASGAHHRSFSLPSAFPTKSKDHHAKQHSHHQRIHVSQRRMATISCRMGGTSRASEVVTFTFDDVKPLQGSPPGSTLPTALSHPASRSADSAFRYASGAASAASPSVSAVGGAGVSTPSSRSLQQTRALSGSDIGAAGTSGPMGAGGGGGGGPNRKGHQGGSDGNDDGSHTGKHHYGSMNFSQVFGSSAFRGPLLFLIGGVALATVLTAWAKGSALRLLNPYEFTVAFPIALGLDKGVPLRLKGVQIGDVKEVRSGLEFVEAIIQVHQKTTRIPRGSSLVFNKAGALTPAASIDVRLPKDPQTMTVPHAPSAASSSSSSAAADQPVSSARHSRSLADVISRLPSSGVAAAVAAAAGPDDVDACRLEGALVCRGDRVIGVQGGGMDELTGLMLKNMIRGAEPEQLPPGLRALHAPSAAR